MSTLGRQLELHAPDARRDHIHLVAILYVGATFMLLLGAMSSQNNLLFATVGLALAAVIVSGFLAGSSMMGLRFARRLPVKAEAGKPAKIVYHTSNRNKIISAFALRVLDVASGPAGTDLPIRAGIDRVPARGEQRVEAFIEFPHRGRWALGPGRLLTMFPFGISKKSMRFNREDAIVVMPESVELRHGVLGPLESAGDEGRADFRRKGGGAELYNLREYQRGDPVSSIAWQASARWSKLISREVAAPQCKRVWIVIEASLDDLRDREEKAEASVRLALAVGKELNEAGIASGLSVPSCGIYIQPDHADNTRPTWANLLATLGDEPPKKASPRGHSMSDGIISVGAGTTPASTIVLDPAKEESYIRAKRVNP
ncbi:MAG: DUF58 domain-containing protein [Phycisphaera sp.]|nr:MAG: DUF58 domain-containing protein [Phycisphaera sp.]